MDSRINETPMVIVNQRGNIVSVNRAMQKKFPGAVPGALWKHAFPKDNPGAPWKGTDGAAELCTFLNGQMEMLTLGEETDCAYITIPRPILYCTNEELDNRVNQYKKALVSGANAIYEINVTRDILENAVLTDEDKEYSFYETFQMNTIIPRMIRNTAQNSREN